MSLGKRLFTSSSATVSGFTLAGSSNKSNTGTFSLSNGDKTVTFTTNTVESQLYSSVEFAADTGTYYFEVKMVDFDTDFLGRIEIDIVALNGSYADYNSGGEYRIIGVSTAYTGGEDGFRANVNGGSVTQYVGAVSGIANGTVIGISLNTDTDTVSWRKNGSAISSQASSTFASGVSYYSLRLRGRAGQSGSAHPNIATLQSSSSEWDYPSF